MKLLRLLLAPILLMSGVCLAQTTYTEVLASNNQCYINNCHLGESQFSPPATMSYTNSIRSYGNQSFTGTLTFNGNTYTDFMGTLTHPPNDFSRWELRGTFNNGLSIIVEDWVCFRSCGGAKSGYVEMP